MSLTSGPADYGAAGASSAPTNLGDILERVLDKGLVVAGDIRVNLLDIELLTIKLRLVIASLETAREVGINWWENDPWLQGREVDRSRGDDDLEAENRELRRRVAELESVKAPDAVEPATRDGDRGAREVESARPARKRRRDD